MLKIRSFLEYKKCLASAKYGNDRGNIRVGSPSFMEGEIKYVSSIKIANVFGGNFENFISNCPTTENRNQLINEHFETLFNADINGSLNIMRKYLNEVCDEIISPANRGLVMNPVKI